MTFALGIDDVIQTQPWLVSLNLDPDIESHAASSVVTISCHTGIAVVKSSRRFVSNHIVQDFPRPSKPVYCVNVFERDARTCLTAVSCTLATNP